MMEKMGWKDGEGLGKDSTGLKEPVCTSQTCPEFSIIFVNHDFSFKEGPAMNLSSNSNLLYCTVSHTT